MLMYELYSLTMFLAPKYCGCTILAPICYLVVPLSIFFQILRCDDIAY